MSIIETISALDHALTVSELGKYLQLGRTAIYDMVRRGAIPHIRIGYNIPLRSDRDCRLASQTAL